MRNKSLMQHRASPMVDSHAERDAGPAAPESSSWYLDPLAALQKRRINLEVVQRALEGVEQPPRVVLKTDLFEEANGDDQLLFDLDLGQETALGFDLSADTAMKAGARSPRRPWPLFAADARALCLATGSVDLIISTSTLDHMERAVDIERALRELYRVLRPGGRLALTLDNPWNPVYPVLQVLCATPWAPFELGRTIRRGKLDRVLRDIGFEDLVWRPIVHNPRLVSTAYFMVLRRLMGDGAEPWIARALALFDRFEQLPTRWVSCCFNAVCAVKPAR